MNPPFVLYNIVLSVCLLSPLSSAFLLWSKLSPRFLHRSPPSPSPTPISIDSRPDYQYNWNIYQQSQNPTVLFPQSERDYHFQPPQPSPSPFSGLFKKPWLGWKWNKFGLGRSKSPCYLDPIDVNPVPCHSPCCGYQPSSSPEQSIIQTTVQHTRPSYDHPVRSESSPYPHFVFYPSESLSSVSYADEPSQGNRFTLGEIGASGSGEASDYISS